MKKKVTGINIQYPISSLILSGEKTIETRTYPMPAKYVGEEMAIVETPGKEGKFKARIVGIIVFGASFKYQSEKSFYKDTKKHCVNANSMWKWVEAKPKWGWPILKVKKLNAALPAPKKKGIKFTHNVSILE